MPFGGVYDSPFFPLSGGLTWSKIPHVRGYELKGRKGEIVGSLRHRSIWSAEVLAESPHGSWKFRPAGTFHTRTVILDSNSGEKIATLKRNWGCKADLVFSDGQTFQLASKGFWRPVWMVVTADGQPLVSIHSREKTVELHGRSYVPEDRLILMIMFAWHSMQQAAQDASSVAAIVAATS